MSTDQIADKNVLEIGMSLSVQVDTMAEPVTSTLVGLMPNQFIIITPTRFEITKKTLSQGKEATIRFLYDKNPFEFRTKLIEVIKKPVELLMLKYPESVKQNERRTYKRNDCFIPVTINLCGQTAEGIIRDISKTGCRCNILSSEGKVPSNCVQKKIDFKCRFPGTIEEKSIGGIVNNCQTNEGILTVGVIFSKLPVDLQKAIDRYIFSIENFS